MTSMGKYRHLLRSSDPAGFFMILAIDHRDNLRAQFNDITDSQFATFKQDVINAALPHSTALLTDPAFGIGPGMAARSIPGQIGLLAPIEVTNYDLHASQRQMQLIPHWSVAKVKRMGGDGIKMLLPYHPDDPCIK
jgi:tagatose 1,6-diphosphate aldolase